MTNIECSSLLKTAYTGEQMKPIQEERNSSLCLKKKELKWLGYSQPRQLVMCTSIPCFLLVQIAPTDNQWPKLNDELSHHQWLKT